MPKGIKAIAAGIGAAALLTAGLTVAEETSGYSKSTYSIGGAGATVMPSAGPTTLATNSFAAAAKATPPCGFAATGTC